ncbi:MAG TPA: hypothetical protein VGH72_33900 [Pseudonocardia sp.]
MPERSLRKATGNPPQQTEEIERMNGTINGTTDLVPEFPEGEELGLSVLGRLAAAADVSIEERLAALRQLDLSLSPDE